MATKVFTLSTTSLTAPTNTTTLITGGSAGIGLQTALLLHSLPNNNVVILDRSPPSGSTPSSLLTSPRFLRIPCDITSWHSQRSAFATAASKFGGIDHVFVNAGIAEYKDQFFTDDLDADGELAEPDRRTVDVDLRAVGDTVKLAVWWLKKNGGRGGSVVMTASLAGDWRVLGRCCTVLQHGIVGLMRALKNDLATLNIAISVVGPGITLTDIVSGRKPGQSLQDWAKGHEGSRRANQ